MSKRYGKVGFSIRTEIYRVNKDVYMKLQEFSTPNLSDAMNRFRTMDYMIKPANEHCSFIGPAITVRVRPGDNLMIHKAIDVARAGDVLVIDAESCCTNAVWGELLTRAALKKGISGVVIDGATRDIKESRELGIPIFSKYVVPSACDKDGPGEINEPISCGGVAIIPGDIIVGDENGVVVIPPDLIDEVIENVKVKREYEMKRIKNINDGMVISNDIDSILEEKGIILD